MEITVKFKLNRWLKLFGEFTRSVPWATREALSLTADDARNALRDTLNRYVTVRKPWPLKGIQSRKATLANMTSKVIVKDEVLALTAIGGERLPEVGKTVAVPIKARPQKTAVTGPQKWPGALLRNKAKYFVEYLEDGTSLVWKRLKRGKRLMYAIKKSVHIDQQWPAFDIVQAVVDRQFHRHCFAALDRAVAKTRAKMSRKR